MFVDLPQKIQLLGPDTLYICDQLVFLVVVNDFEVVVETYCPVGLWAISSVLSSWEGL